MSTPIYKKGVLIYRGQKGPGHKCDPACKRADHWYQHEFKQSRGPAIGSPDKRSVRMGNLILSRAPAANPRKKKR